MRGNASAPMTLDNVTPGDNRALTAAGKGLDLMLGVVLLAFQVGSAAVALGIAEAAVRATTRHLTRTRSDHLNSSLAELPTLVRAWRKCASRPTVRGHSSLACSTRWRRQAIDAAPRARGEGLGE